MKDFFNLLNQSINDFVYDLFEALDASRGSSGGNTQRKKTTVSAQFKVSQTRKRVSSCCGLMFYA